MCSFTSLPSKVAASRASTKAMKSSTKLKGDRRDCKQPTSPSPTLHPFVMTTAVAASAVAVVATAGVAGVVAVVVVGTGTRH